MRPLPVSLMSMVIIAGLLGANTAHAERRIIILQDPGPQGPSLEMSAPLVASARSAAAKEARDAGLPPGHGASVKLPQMQVSAIATTVDGRREVLLRDANNPQNTASMQWPKGPGDPAVQFTVGQTVNFEPTGTDQGWQVKDNQGRPLEYLPEATGPRDIFDTRR
ncbi:hypothetical protein I5U86_20370 [Stenotrophomonas maltophilia]|uniref:hypothetical protein n=1 Tax=Stenotrophomonas TaxID=40323 RepID=UPI0018D31FBA|nr:hypothetical protein [Stenotrophomonas sp. PS02299]MBH1692786.1 hypothetical protein [Stenotrophomonas maltophilia]MBH1709840.1 hypothetical protein [Stenotrophomonas maltophilia]MBH1850331.1 hypothetical protein [Stenotrophomonas maltophilia]